MNKIKDWQRSQYWDSRFQRGDMPWDLQAPNKTLLFLEELLSSRIAGWHEKVKNLLVPGCGHGNDVIALLEKGYTVHAVDWSQVAVQLLEERIFLGRLESRGSTEKVDFFEYRVSEDKKFDALIEHTLFCAIDPSDRPKYIESVKQNVRKGGFVLANFFIDESIESGTSLHLTKEGPPFTAHLKEIENFFNGWTKIIRFEASPQGEEGRKPGIEWTFAAQII